MSADAAEYWWIADRGVTTGPFSTAQLRTEIEQGHVSRSSQICRSGETQWKAIGDVAAFAEATVESPTAPPANAPAAGPTNAQWEYLVRYINDFRALPEDVTELAQLGAEGWELTAVQQPYFYFKRPLN